jgi:hypothetical protein
MLNDYYALKKRWNNAMGSALPRPEGLLKMEYVPREQFVPFHKRKQRHSVLVTHRRCGKTVASICDLIMRAVAHPGSKPAGRFAYIATTYSAGKDIAWEMLKAYSRPFLCEQPNESELRVDFWNGARIRIYGSDSPDALRGLAFNQVVLDEYADMPPSLFSAVIRPARTGERLHSCAAIPIPTILRRRWPAYARSDLRGRRSSRMIFVPSYVSVKSSSNSSYVIGRNSGFSGFGSGFAACFHPMARYPNASAACEAQLCFGVSLNTFNRSSQSLQYSRNPASPCSHFFRFAAALAETF